MKHFDSYYDLPKDEPDYCRCGKELPEVGDDETAPEFCSAKCKLEAAAPALLENLQYVSSAAPECYGTLDDHETIEVTMTVKAIKDIRAAIEAAKG